jgi:rubrerythrin
MSNNSNLKGANDQPLPVLPLPIGGNIGAVMQQDTYKCNMCGQIFERKNECPIFHSIMCMGF